MTLNIGFHASFDNMKEWKGIWKKAGEVEFSMGVTLLT
jgi:hypothetical protein